MDPLNFKQMDEKDMLCQKAQLDLLEHLSVYINNLRESMTRELIVNGVKDEEMLKEKLEKIKIEQLENHIDLGVGKLP
jgi:hypothetical protein|tara:strand:- start:93 stop:326 length:234 start_codon:yes stop_codon:yes gene_type:complete